MKKIFIILLLLFTFVIVLSGCSRPDWLETLNEYRQSFNDQNYTMMHQSLSNQDKAKFSTEEFEKIHKDFYKSIGASGVEMEILSNDQEIKEKIEKNEPVTVLVKIKINSEIGERVNNANMTLIKEKIEGKDQWCIDWDYSLIQGIEEGSHIKEETTNPVRGEILDRNNKQLAKNGEVIEVGIVPGRLGDMKSEIIQDIADTFNLSTEFINDRISLSWVKEDTFVNILRIAKEDVSLIEQIYTKNNGATYRVVQDRVYPYKDMTAHLTGYLGYINEEELKELQRYGFTANDKVGRTGLEKVFDVHLRGKPGIRVTIVNQDGVEQQLLYEVEKEDGKNLKLNIDMDLQAKLFKQMKDDQGAGVCMDYKTGEVLALVSTPSYDPNEFILGIGAENLQALQNDEKKPLVNRFTKVYVPGSTIKPITAAIALQGNKIDENFSINISGKQWQKDASWGNHFITRVTDPGGMVNLEKGMIYSDNIYFAQVALKIGGVDFIEKAKHFGIGKNLDLRYSVEKSQLASKDEIENEVLLADTGYGQGEVLMSILNLSKAYTVFVNEGNIVEPILISESNEPKVSNVISKSVADQVFNLMRRVVEDNNGTAHDAMIAGKIIAGKTGTAEIDNKEDNLKKAELGWFIAVDKNDNQPYITSMMIENVENKGGSHFVTPKVKEFILSY